ncbi:Beta-galactosidase [Cyphellophora attinorum]|uniref:Beta-galactosidase n=1 Tax=Cyphellophora attinorum TaxID=1664694 RepID=A0A0N1HBI2_9EURO|nr:Beta-galactosidase [Phialophora attinorum]KPI40733.1 Beta-galactosidase [Phialophora attinorum]
MKVIFLFLGALLLYHTAGAVIDYHRVPPYEAPTTYTVQKPPLDTPWTYRLGSNPWPEYPRPQLQREHWQNLNGIWKYRNATGPNEPPPWNQDLPHEVLVPSCLESALSGVQGEYTIHSWFSTNFTVPELWRDGRVLLNFGAVDYEAVIYINGQQIAINRGGYATFTIDVTDYVSTGDEPDAVNPIGKQTLQDPNHYFYTPCSGIWQSVWIEAAATEYVTRLDLSGDMNGQVTVNVHTLNSVSGNAEIRIRDRDQSATILAANPFKTNGEFIFTTGQVPKRWSPDSPVLYDVEIIVGGETIRSYMGFRTYENRNINGVYRPMLNGEFIFPFGTLDQGYWPDGIYVAPNRKAMTYDLNMLKAVGFNMVRKHIKVEPSLFYTACDELGLLVIQDMPSPRTGNRIEYSNCTRPPYLPNVDEQADFVDQLGRMVDQLKSHPSIFAWTIYNEGWGQLLTRQNGHYQEFDLVDLVRSRDPTRLISATSGWTDHGAGDFSDTHSYASPKCGTPFYKIPSPAYDPTRIAFQGEFGGIGHNLTDAHLWKVQDAIDTINQTYEINADLNSFNYRARQLLREFREQVELFDCSGGVWTQTTDVEGELNGLLSYDRRVLRVDLNVWRTEIQALYDAAAARGAMNYSIGEPVELELKNHL